MVCKKCGFNCGKCSFYKQKDACCPNCGNEVRDKQPPLYGEDVLLRSKSMSECVWFAPVSVLVSSVLGFFIQFLLFVFVNKKVTDIKINSVLIAVSGGVVGLLISLFCVLIIYFAATSAADKNKSSVASPVKYLFWFLGNAASFIPEIICKMRIDASFFSLNIFAVKSVFTLILTLIFSLLSYFIAIKYLEKIDSLRTDD